MILLSANNATTTLGAAVNSTQVTIALAPGTGSAFPSPGTNQYFTITLNDALTGLRFEICYCTSRTSDTLTVIRGQEGTSAQNWLLGDNAYNANTAASIQSGRAFSATNTPNLPFTIPATHNGVTQICGSTGTITLPPSSTISDGFLTGIECSDSSATITINPNSSNVVLPGSFSTSNFNIFGQASFAILQWSAETSAWNLIGGSPFSFYQLFSTITSRLGSYLPNTTYSNPSTLKPMFVSVYGYCSSNSANIVLIVNGTPQNAMGQQLAGTVFSCSGMVPAGGTYEVTVTAGTLTVEEWTEVV